MGEKYEVTSAFVYRGELYGPGATIADLDRTDAVALLRRGKLKGEIEPRPDPSEEGRRAIVEEQEALEPEADTGVGAAKRGAEALAESADDVNAQKPAADGAREAEATGEPKPDGGGRKKGSAKA